MLRNFFVALLIILGLSAGPALARDLQVEVEVLHVAGRLSPAEFEAMLADERLGIEVFYYPTRLIDGVTARRERILPIGSKLFAISHDLSLTSDKIERQGRLLRFQVPGSHPDHPEYYRLNSVELLAPDADTKGKRGPFLRIGLMRSPPEPGARETALFMRLGESDVGLRLRYRWSDAQGATVVDPLTCSSEIESLGNGQYRFRTHHRVAGLFRALASTVQSDPPSRPRAGQRSLRLREPYPEPLAGWRLSRNHLVQMDVEGQAVERFSIYAEQPGPGRCRRTRSYEALFAKGRLVELQRNLTDYDCGAEEGTQAHYVEANWLDDGSLTRYVASTPQGSQTWDGFLASTAAQCKTGVAPPSAEVQALIAETQSLREAFNRP